METLTVPADLRSVIYDDVLTDKAFVMETWKWKHLVDSSRYYPSLEGRQVRQADDY